MNRTVRSQQRTTKPAALGLGERLRQLRVAAGLTQSELAGERFSKEYVSQIERGKTRPTSETIEWLAQRLARRRRLPRERRLDRRARPCRGRARTRRGADRRSDQCEAALELYERRSRPCSRRAPRSSRRACSQARRARMAIEGEVREAITLLEQARGLVEGANVLRRRACRGRLRARRRPLQAFEHLDGARALQRGARARRALRPPVLTCSAPRSSRGARGATAGSATSRPRRKTSSARSSSLARSTTAGDGARVLPGVRARRARGPLGARAQVRRAGEVDLRGSRRAPARRPAAQQPRRPSRSCSGSPTRPSST